MVRYALVMASVLLPLVMGNAMMDQMMRNYMMQQYNMGNMHNVQINGMMHMGQPMQNMNNWGMMHEADSADSSEEKDNSQESSEEKDSMNSWWGIKTQEDQEAYLRWCEERKMQMKEQEEAQKLLRQITQQAEDKKREYKREKMMKESKAKRENMVAQWRMWERQLKQTEEYSGAMDKYTDMKVKYMFSLTMDYLKFCKCSDDTAPLQRYLRYDGMSYEPGMSEAYDLSDLEGVDLNDEEAVAQRMATLSESDQIKLFFTGMVMTTCDAVKAYIGQLKQWETQYNFMGM